MQVITSDFIQKVFNQVHPNKNLLSTTISYLQELFQPYDNLLGPINDLNTLQQWIHNDLQGDLASHSISWIHRALRKNPADIHLAKQTLFEYLLGEILELAGNLAESYGDNNVTPWDILSVTNTDEEFQAVLKPQSQTEIPVTVRVGSEYFIHNMTFEFFSYVSSFSFDPIISGVLFDISYVTNENRFNNPGKRFHPYSFDFSEYFPIFFDTTSFIQGFNTGCLWSNLNFKGTITQYNNDGTTTLINY